MLMLAFPLRGTAFVVKLDSARLFVGTGRVVDLFECVVDVGVAEEAAEWQSW
jgi:hypothetical protein